MEGHRFSGQKIHLLIRVHPRRVEAQTRYSLGGQVTQRACPNLPISTSQGGSWPSPRVQAPEVRSQRYVKHRVAHPVSPGVAHLPCPTSTYSSNPNFSELGFTMRVFGRIGQVWYGKAAVGAKAPSPLDKSLAAKCITRNI